MVVLDACHRVLHDLLATFTKAFILCKNTRFMRWLVLESLEASCNCLRIRGPMAFSSGVSHLTLTNLVHTIASFRFHNGLNAVLSKIFGGSLYGTSVDTCVKLAIQESPEQSRFNLKYTTSGLSPTSSKT